MPTLTVSSLAALGFVAVGAAVLVDDAHRANSTALRNHLTAEETAAFKSCRSQMSGNGLSTFAALGGINRNFVPDEICVCQARHIADVLKPDHYDDHRLIVAFNYGAAEQSLEVSHLNQGNTDGHKQFARLAQNLSSCANTYFQQKAARKAERKLKFRQEHASTQL